MTLREGPSPHTCSPHFSCCPTPLLPPAASEHASRPPVTAGPDSVFFISFGALNQPEPHLRGLSGGMDMAAPPGIVLSAGICYSEHDHEAPKLPTAAKLTYGLYGPADAIWTLLQTLLMDWVTGGRESLNGAQVKVHTHWQYIHTDVQEA